jgi:hypothetical protein
MLRQPVQAHAGDRWLESRRRLIATTAAEMSTGGMAVVGENYAMRRQGGTVDKKRFVAASVAAATLAGSP